MNKDELMRHKAQHEAMIDVAKLLLPHLEGKNQTGLKILLKSDELSTKIIEFGANYADPKHADDFSEQKLNDVLEYLGMIETGLQQFIDSKKKGEIADA